MHDGRNGATVVRSDRVATEEAVVVRKAAPGLFARPLRVGDTGIQIEGDFTGKEIVRFAVDLLTRYNKLASEVMLTLVHSTPKNLAT